MAKRIKKQAAVKTPATANKAPEKAAPAEKSKRKSRPRLSSYVTWVYFDGKLRELVIDASKEVNDECVALVNRWKGWINIENQAQLGFCINAFEVALKAAGEGGVKASTIKAMQNRLGKLQEAVVA